MAWTETTPSGRWRGGYRTADGKRRHKTFDHKKAAERWAQAEEQKVVDGSRRDPARGRMKWSTWCAQWWPSRQLEPGALRSQVSLREHHVMPRWGEVPLNEIVHLDVQVWVNGLSTRLSASSSRQAYYQLSASLKAAVRAGVLDVSPCTAVRLPATPPAPERYLTDAEIADVFYHLDEPYRTLAEVLLHTGLRVGEAVVLHEHRIDWSAMTIDVIEKWDQYAHTVRAYGKSKRRRTVPISPRLAEILTRHLDTRPSGASSCGFTHEAGSVCRSGLILLGPRGAVLDPHNVANVQWAEALDLAKVGHARLHDLRHTYASRLITGGVSIARLQRLLGHESMTTTMRYSHLLDDGYDEVRDALARHDKGTAAGTNSPADLATARRKRSARNSPSPAPEPNSLHHETARSTR